LNSPPVNPATSFGTAVVIAFITDPNGPKRMVEALLNMDVAQSVTPATWGTNVVGALNRNRIIAT
jgi:hypothetical protein